MNLILEVSEEFKSNKFIVIILLVVQMSGLALYDQKDKRAASKVSSSYALNVMKHGLRHAKTHEEVILTINQWNEKEHNAKIGALITLCDTDREVLETLMPSDTIIESCRLAN